MNANSSALIPFYVSKFENKTLANLCALVTGVALLSALAQIVIPLPWTPVPITGQTFAVTLVSLTWGMKRAASIVLVYLALGVYGFPVFAMGASGALMGPTVGYLVGMVFSSIVVGKLADLGFSKSFKKALLASYCGSFFIFATGLFVLSFYVPNESLLYVGLFPFLLGDFIKNTLASLFAVGFSHKI